MMNWGSTVTLAKNLIDGLLDLVYPPKCLVCGEFQPRYFCDECRRKISLIGSQVCRRCGAPVDQLPCKECSGRDLYFDEARSTAVYEDPLREAIHQLKFSCHSCIAPDLAEIMCEYVLNEQAAYGARSSDILVPIPVDKKRRRERGFNQSLLLAEQLAVTMRKPVVSDVLTRVKSVPPQSNLGYEERLVNLEGVFTVTDVHRIAGVKILLIDDVYTTGSTVNEASKTLKEAGASEVRVLTLARSI